MTPEQRHASLVHRYNELVIRNETGCWGWRRYVNPRPGYPMLGSGKSNRITMHRLSYEIHVGPIRGGQWVLHHCDNKICTRPDHLYLGTQHDNGQDIQARATSRKDQCRRGHLRTPENTYSRTDRRGYVELHCKICSSNYPTFTE